LVLLLFGGRGAAALLWGGGKKKGSLAKQVLLSRKIARYACLGDKKKCMPPPEVQKVNPSATCKNVGRGIQRGLPCTRWGRKRPGRGIDAFKGTNGHKREKVASENDRDEIRSSAGGGK